MADPLSNLIAFTIFAAVVVFIGYQIYSKKQKSKEQGSGFNKGGHPTQNKD